MNRIKIAQIGVGHDHSDLITSLMRQNDIFDVKGFCVCDGEEAHYRTSLYACWPQYSTPSAASRNDARGISWGAVLYTKADFAS